MGHERSSPRSVAAASPSSTPSAIARIAGRISRLRDAGRFLGNRLGGPPDFGSGGFGHVPRRRLGGSIGSRIGGLAPDVPAGSDLDPRDGGRRGMRRRIPSPSPTDPPGIAPWRSRIPHRRRIRLAGARRLDPLVRPSGWRAGDDLRARACAGDALRIHGERSEPRRSRSAPGEQVPRHQREVGQQEHRPGQGADPGQPPGPGRSGSPSRPSGPSPADRIGEWTPDRVSGRVCHGAREVAPGGRRWITILFSSDCEDSVTEKFPRSAGEEPRFPSIGWVRRCLSSRASAAGLSPLPPVLTEPCARRTPRPVRLALVSNPTCSRLSRINW